MRCLPNPWCAVPISEMSHERGWREALRRDGLLRGGLLRGGASRARASWRLGRLRSFPGAVRRVAVGPGRFGHRARGPQRRRQVHDRPCRDRARAIDQGPDLPRRRGRDRSSDVEAGSPRRRPRARGAFGVRDLGRRGQPSPHLHARLRPQGHRHGGNLRRRYRSVGPSGQGGQTAACSRLPAF